jgi:formate hydrogenlyase subunit 3/multisubunit Na+/H+ antiporter MnhD subunit
MSVRSEIESEEMGVVESGESPRSRREGRDWLGSLAGLVVFLGGVALLVKVFQIAYDLYTTPPRVSMEMKPGQPLDVAFAADRFTGLVVKVIVLILMAGLASVIANRGIIMYTRSRQNR